MAKSIAARYGAILAILLAGLLLRLHAVGSTGFWIDETATAVLAALPWNELFGPVARLETNPPAYFAAMKAWTAIAGTSDAAFRLPSAVAGTGAIVAVWLLAGRAFGTTAGLFAAVVLAGAGWPVFQSREARGYIFLMAFFALGLLAARTLAQHPTAPWRRVAGPIAGLALSGAGAAAMHYTGILAAGVAHAYALLLLLARGQVTLPALLRITVAGLLCLALTTPILLLGIGLASDADNAASWMREISAMWVTRSTIEIVTLAPPDIITNAGLRIAVAIGASGFALMVLWLLLRRDAPRDEVLALAGCVGIGLVLFLAMQTVTPVILPRTLSFLYIPLAALVGAAIQVLRTPARKWAALSVFLLIQAPAVTQAMATPFREHWRDLALALTHAAAPGDVVVAIGAFEAFALQRYRPGGAMPDVIIGSPIGIQLQRHILRHAEGAVSVSADRLVTTLCAQGRTQPPTVHLVTRPSGPTGRVLNDVEAALRGAGATPGTPLMVGTLSLAGWHGLRCPLAEP